MGKAAPEGRLSTYKARCGTNAGVSQPRTSFLCRRCGRAAVVISHDRWFLDRVATHILAWEGDDDNPAKWYWFEGNFQAYQENKVTRLGEDAARPHRLHKKLVRG